MLTEWNRHSSSNDQFFIGRRWRIQFRACSLIKSLCDWKGTSIIICILLQLNVMRWFVYLWWKSNEAESRLQCAKYLMLQNQHNIRNWKEFGRSINFILTLMNIGSDNDGSNDQGTRLKLLRSGNLQRTFSNEASRSHRWMNLPPIYNVVLAFDALVLFITSIVLYQMIDGRYNTFKRYFVALLITAIFLQLLSLFRHSTCVAIDYYPILQSFDLVCYVTNVATSISEASFFILFMYALFYRYDSSDTIQIRAATYSHSKHIHQMGPICTNYRRSHQNITRSNLEREYCFFIARVIWYKCYAISHSASSLVTICTRAVWNRRCDWFGIDHKDDSHYLGYMRKAQEAQSCSATFKA